MPKQKMAMVLAVVVLVIAGCRDDENKRLADQAERNLERQSAQELRNMEVHREVAEGTKRLVEADASAREEVIGLHRDVQAERFEIGKQRDQIETERREIAATRNRDPLVAESIKSFGMMIAISVVLVITLQILRQSDEPDQNAAIAELLVEDLCSPSPKLTSARAPIQAESSIKPSRLSDQRSSC